MQRLGVEKVYCDKQSGKDTDRLELRKMMDFVRKGDIESLSGHFMLTIFGAVAELEREYIRQRQSEGIAIAQAEGRFQGRPKKAQETFESVYIDWKDKKITAADASRQCEIARSTFYRKVKDYEAEHGGKNVVIKNAIYNE